MPQVSKICSEVMLLDSGQISFHGRDVVKGVEAYYSLFPGEEKKSFGDRVQVKDVRINGNSAMEDIIECNHGEPFKLEIDFSVDVDFPEMRLGVQFFDKDLKPVATVHSDIFQSTTKNLNTISVTLPVNQFSIGKFTVGMSFMQFDSNGIMTEIIKRYMGISTFKMAGVSVFSPATFQLIGDWKTDDSNTRATEN